MAEIVQETNVVENVTVTLTLTGTEAKALYWAIDECAVEDYLIDADLCETYAGIAVEVEKDLYATLVAAGLDPEDDNTDGEPDPGGHSVVAIDGPAKPFAPGSGVTFYQEHTTPVTDWERAELRNARVAEAIAILTNRKRVA